MPDALQTRPVQQRRHPERAAPHTHPTLPPHQPQGKIKNLETIYLFSMPVKEYQIVEYFLGAALKDEVMKIMPVQKQTRAGQRTRFKAFVVVGDHNGHVGLGVKCAKEVRGRARAGGGRRRLGACACGSEAITGGGRGVGGALATAVAQERPPVVRPAPPPVLCAP